MRSAISRSVVEKVLSSTFTFRNCFLHGENVRGVHQRADFFPGRVTRAIANNFFFAGARGITHSDAHQEAIELRFRQRVSAVMFDGILRREHEERLRQRMGMVVHRDLSFVHGFEEREDCVLGVVRLISSATMMLAKIGPGLNWNSCAAGLNTLTPMTSLGSRSDVN